MESPDGAGLLHSLNAVVTFLHSEGFYAAEESLLREIENRYPAPDAISPRHISTSPGSSGGDDDGGDDGGGAAAAAAPELRGQEGPGPDSPHGNPVLDFQPALAAAQCLTPVDSMDSAEKVLEAWRSKSTTPAASPKKAVALSPPASPPSASKPWGTPGAGSSSDVDEYEDEDDPGFQRLDVVGQEAALGFDLDQSEASGTPGIPYFQLQQDDEPPEQDLPAHARHSSIDMGLLNRQLHGSGSASSSQQGHPKQQQQQQQQQSQLQPPQLQPPPMLLYEPVTSGDHWGSQALLLPAGAPAGGPAPGVQPSQSQAAQQEQVQQRQRRKAEPGSPQGSSEGGSSFFSGELAGSPQKRAIPTSAHQRSSSYAQRQAGTAQWVFDRANSADTDAYRSLLSHLDRPSGGQSQTSGAPSQPEAVAEEEPQQQEQQSQLTQQQQQQQQQQLQEAAIARQDARRLLPPLPPPQHTAAHPPLLSAASAEAAAAATAAAGDTEEEEAAARPLFHQESISRVSSLGESMLQEAAALCLQDLQQQQQQQQDQQQQQGEGEQQRQQGGKEEQQEAGVGDQQAAVAAAAVVAPQAAAVYPAAAATPQQAAPALPQGVRSQEQHQEQQQAQQQQEQQGARLRQDALLEQQQRKGQQQEQQQQHAQQAADGPSQSAHQRRHSHPLPLLRMGPPVSGQEGASLPRRRSVVSTAADTTAADHGSEGGSPLGSEAHTPDGTSMIDHSDPFSFPVTPPSEAAPPPDPAPLFGSWASFKSSPDRKSGFGEYGTEDESTPARRRYQQQRAAAAAAIAAAAKEQGGVQRSIKFPPLGAPGRAGSSGLLGGYGSSSQLLSYTAPGRALADDDNMSADFDQEHFDRKYEVLTLKIVHRRHCTGFEQNRELPLHIDDLIAGRYQIVDLLGQAAFSRAVQALDLKTGALVCLKIIKNNKDYFDQGLDEVKLLQYVNAADPGDESGLLRLFDFFYFKEHLVLVTELLRANLYEFQKYNRESGDEPYFTLPRIQSIARQVLTSLSFLHSLSLVHADLKPENILVKSYSRCQVKVIDLGSSCFLTDHLSSYVQSRSYRAPEVILGLQYDQKVDVWSLGCILAELATGRVLFQNDSIATLLARLEGILGSVPRWMLNRGRYAHKYFLRDGRIFEKNQQTARYEFLRPKATSLGRRVPQADEPMLAFLKCLLQVDPTKRPTAAEALQHPWLQLPYY